MDLKTRISERAALVNAALKSYLPKDNSLISQAMRYSVNAGGKRLRPILVLEGAQACGGRPGDYLAAACALEYIHTYSLIHDDLPAMDNDDLRRGKPTSHKKYGEAVAILAGDALLTDAFRLIAECSKKRGFPPGSVIDTVKIVSEAAGRTGMIAGQVTDTLEAGARHKRNISVSKRKLLSIHPGKTAALIPASLVTG